MSFLAAAGLTQVLFLVTQVLFLVTQVLFLVAKGPLAWSILAFQQSIRVQDLGLRATWNRSSEYRGTSLIRNCAPP